MSALRIIVGLGNPGTEYVGTRHNAGFWFVDALAQTANTPWSFERKLHGESSKISVAGESLLLFKPTTLMNRSGVAVASALHYWKISPNQMLVVHDDLDLPVGTVRLKYDGGHGGQNGLKDIFAHLGHGGFYRLRVGIGHPGHKDRVTSWVLGRPSREDEQAIRDSLARALEILPLAVKGESEAAMKRLHTKIHADDK